MNAHKSPRTLEAAEALYIELQAQGFDVLLDDRNERRALSSLTRSSLVFHIEL